jgi:hypothetical protein
VLVNFATIALGFSAVVRLSVVAVASAVCVGVVHAGWPELARVEIAYGLSARIPVALIMLVAMLANWGTHYELGAPDFPEMALLPKWFWIGLLPQLSFWMAFTVLFGSLFGSVAVAIFHHQKPASG